MYEVVLIVVVFLSLTIGLSIGASGCSGTETAAFLAGAGAMAEGIELANANMEKVDEINALAEKFLKSNDPNDIAELLVTLNAIDPNAANMSELIATAVEKYEEGHSLINGVKENAKKPSYWVALVMMLTAAYQKKRRMDGK